ncbi:MAG: 6-phosphogluconolactonase [Candidatus Obscuribacterales bacterium]|nr:6-phosphogluconolactonase [Candidatus Obscuribacterales bacterium]
MTDNSGCQSQITVCPDKSDLAIQAAKHFVQNAVKAVAAKGQCYVALSGGSTPKLLYKELCKPEISQLIPWAQIHFFVSDERCVPESSDESNFGNAKRLLFDLVPVNQANLHPCLDPGKDPARSASALETLIKKTVPLNGDGLPSFDLIWLGMGPDGHTASLFPDTLALQEKVRLVKENFVPKVEASRITFTYKLINQAKTVIFLVSGSDKAQVLSEILSAKKNYPAADVCPIDGELVWLLDKEAASQLSASSCQQK